MARDNADLNPVSAMENPAGLEQRVADWYQNSTIGFHTLNAEGIIVSINDTELNWVGYRRDEVVGKMYIGDFLTEHSKKTLAQRAAHVRSEGKNADIEYEVVRKDGSTFHALVHDFPLHNNNGELIGYHVSSIDITHHKRLEQRLRLSEANFARAQSLAQVGHYEIHLADSRFPAGGMWSQETYRILDRDPSTSPMHLEEFVAHCVHSDDRAAVVQSVQESMTVDHDTELEFRVVLRDGAFRHVKAIGRYAAGLGAQPDKLFGVLIDMTDIKLAQKKIDRSERRFRAMIEKTDETIALFSGDGIVMYASPSASTLMGITPEQLIGKHVWQLIHPDDVPAVAKDLDAIKSVPGSTIFSQFRTPHPSGDWRWVESTDTNRLEDPESARSSPMFAT